MTGALRRSPVGHGWAPMARAGAALAVLAGLVVLVLTGLQPGFAGAVLTIGSGASSSQIAPVAGGHEAVLELRSGHLDQVATVPTQRVQHPLRQHEDAGTTSASLVSGSWNPAPAPALDAVDDACGPTPSAAPGPVGSRAPPRA